MNILIIVFILLMLFIIMYVLHKISCIGDVKVFHGKYKIKKIKKYNKGDIVYYHLYLKDYSIFGYYFYMQYGEYIIDPYQGNVKFIGYVFNSVEDAEYYYENKLK